MEARLARWKTYFLFFLGLNVFSVLAITTSLAFYLQKQKSLDTQWSEKQTQLTEYVTKKKMLDQFVKLNWKDVAKNPETLKSYLQLLELSSEEEKKAISQYLVEGDSLALRRWQEISLNKMESEISRFVEGQKDFRKLRIQMERVLVFLFILGFLVPLSMMWYVQKRIDRLQKKIRSEAQSTVSDFLRLYADKTSSQPFQNPDFWMKAILVVGGRLELRRHNIGMALLMDAVELIQDEWHKVKPESPGSSAFPPNEKEDTPL